MNFLAQLGPARHSRGLVPADPLCSPADNRVGQAPYFCDTGQVSLPARIHAMSSSYMQYIMGMNTCFFWTEISIPHYLLYKAAFPAGRGQRLGGPT